MSVYDLKSGKIIDKTTKTEKYTSSSFDELFRGINNMMKTFMGSFNCPSMSGLSDLAYHLNIDNLHIKPSKAERNIIENEKVYMGTVIESISTGDLEVYDHKIMRKLYLKPGNMLLDSLSDGTLTGKIYIIDGNGKPVLVQVMDSDGNIVKNDKERPTKHY